MLFNKKAAFRPCIFLAKPRHNACTVSLYLIQAIDTDILAAQ